MDKQKFEQAKGALANALNTAGPILAALQQADQVFGVLTNAEKHKKALEKDVATLLADIDTEQKRLDDSKAIAAAAMAEAVDAEKAAKQRIRTAEVESQRQIEEVQKNVAAQIGAAQVAAEEQIATFQVEVKAVRDEHDAKMKAMFGEQQEAETTAAALEKRLNTLRGQAQKFAATLTET